MISQENLKSIVNLKEETVIKTSFEQADTTIEKEILSLIEELDVTGLFAESGTFSRTTSFGAVPLDRLVPVQV